MPELSNLSLIVLGFARIMTHVLCSRAFSSCLRLFVVASCQLSWVAARSKKGRVGTTCRYKYSEVGLRIEG